MRGTGLMKASERHGTGVCAAALSRFDGARLVQDAVLRNLQALAESSQRLSSEVSGRARNRRPHGVNLPGFAR